MATGGDIQLSNESFMELKSVVSDWYDRRGHLIMLKVLYRDIIPLAEVYKASMTMDLLNALVDHNELSSRNLSLLHDTIKVSRQFGLVNKIQEYLPSCSILTNLKDYEVTNFTPYRLKLMKLGFSLSKDDVVKIDALCNEALMNHTDSWNLILDLEKSQKIHKGNMKTFSRRLKILGMATAVDALSCEDIQNPSISGQCQGEVEDINVKFKASLKRKQDFSDGDEGQQHKKRACDNYALELLNEFEKNKNAITLNEIPTVLMKIGKLFRYFDKILINLEGIKSGSIVFNLSTQNPYALMNLWEIHLSGDFINDLAELLVPQNYQQIFVDGWMTCIDETEYKTALRKLKEGECASNVCVIVSNDTEWENKLIWDLRERRPDINYTIVKNWRLPAHEPETVNQLGQSRKVIIGFSRNPCTAYYSKYAANDVVVNMLRGKALDGAKVIPVKISEDAVVPTIFKQFNVISGWEEDFLDTLLQSICALYYDPLELLQGFPILKFTLQRNIVTQKMLSGKSNERIRIPSLPKLTTQQNWSNYQSEDLGRRLYYLGDNIGAPYRRVRPSESIGTAVALGLIVVGALSLGAFFLKKQR